MICTIENRDGSGDSGKKLKLKAKVNQVRLEEKLDEHSLRYDTKELLEPVTNQCLKQMKS